MNSEITYKPVISVDGPAASGKGVISKNISEIYNLYYIDTGIIYRTVAYSLSYNNINLNDSNACINFIKNIDLNSLEYNSKNLRSERIGSIASKIATVNELRKLLVEYQRKLANNIPFGKNGLILDGRDIGTVVFPDATLKFYITAQLEIRAQRRNKQLNKNHKSSTYAAVLLDLKERDKRDINRKTSPLLPAKDAIKIDTSYYDISKVCAIVMSIIDNKISILKKRKNKLT